MKSFSVVALLALCFAALVSSQSAVPRLLGSVPLKDAAFVEVFDDYSTNDPADRYTLYISVFHAISFKQDPKYYLRSPGKLLNNISAWEFSEMEEQATAFWPNNPDYMPVEVAGAQGVVWTSGFLVPGKTKGALELFDTTVDPPLGPYKITGQDEIDWSYHRVIWKDMDGDGDLDALTARFHQPLTGNTHTQFVYLENPGMKLSDTPAGFSWNQHVLQDSQLNGQKGPDVHFRNLGLISRNVTFDCIFAAEFWHEQLALYYTSTGWANWNQVRRLPIDITAGQSFDVYVDDFNRDGKVDLLATAYNHTLGNVFVWEIPEDFRNGTFVKHTIADGFKANTIIGGQSMSPGSPKPFYPSKAYETELVNGRQRKPYILLSGDDDGKHYILEPNSEDPTDWTYTKHILVDTTKTTSGKFAAVDLDGDGFTEIIAAGYTAGQIYVFTYKPE